MRPLTWRSTDGTRSCYTCCLKETFQHYAGRGCGTGSLLFAIEKKGRDQFRCSLSVYQYRAVVNKILKIYAHKKVEDRFLTHLEHYAVSYSESTDYRIREKDIQYLI